MVMHSIRKTVIGVAVAGLLAAGVGSSAFAHGSDEKPGYGPCGGQMGSGMMEGMGPGMMRGWGGGPGMMRGWDGDSDDVRSLSPEQRQKVGTIMREHAQQQGRLLGEAAKMRAELAIQMSAANPDPQAVGKAYKALADVQSQLLENRVEMQNQMQDAMGGSRGHMMDRMSNGKGNSE